MEEEGGHQNGDVHSQINAITDESLESTRRMLALCDESKEGAISTLVNLDDQVRPGFSGADLGGGGRTPPPPPPSGIRPPADPKGPPFDTFSEIHFCPTDPKIFLKAPLAPIYTNFEGERAPKKKGKTLRWESSKNQFGRSKKKKKVVIIFEFFLKIRPPPLEKILDPPLRVLVIIIIGSPTL